MSILALDPSLRCTGLVVLDPDGPEVWVVANARPDKRAETVAEKCASIAEKVGFVFGEWCPLVLAVESGYVPHYKPAERALPEAIAQAAAAQGARLPASNARQSEGKAAGALKTSELRGWLKSLADGTDCEVMDVTPLEAQRALTGIAMNLGRKKRKAEMVRAARLQFPDWRWTQDSADALGVGMAARRRLIDEKLREGAR